MNKLKRQTFAAMATLLLLTAFTTQKAHAVEITSGSATVTEPVAGAKPSTAITSGNPSLYTAEVLKWFSGGSAASPGTEMNLSDAFVAGQTYVVSIRLTPTDGNSFASSPK